MKSQAPINISNDYEAVSHEGANRIVAAIRSKPDLLLCAAGGSTPIRTYQLLTEAYSLNRPAFHTSRVLKLDEWGGIAMDDPGSCETQLRKQLLHPLGVTPDRYIGFKSNPANPDLECEEMHRRLVQEGPIDLCVLGLGLNGHIGMNEPSASLQPDAHVAHLTEVSLRHPMLANTRPLPTYGLTLGMGEIMASLEILLLVSGVNKREPLQRFMSRKITTDFPASFLWLHQNWTLLCDKAAVDGVNLEP